MATKIRRPSSGQMGLGSMLDDIDNKPDPVNNAMNTGTVGGSPNGQTPKVQTPGDYSDPEADFLAASYMSALQPTQGNPVFDIVNQPTLQGNMSTPSLGSTPIFAGGGTILQRREQKIDRAALKAVGGKRPEMKAPEGWAPHQEGLSRDYSAMVNRYYKTAVEKYGISATKVLQGDTKLGREFQAAKQNMTDYALQSKEMKVYYDKVAADIKAGAYVSEDARKAAEYVSSEKWVEDLMSGKHPDLVGNTMERLKADVQLTKLINEVQIDSKIWQEMPSVTKQFESDAPDWTVLLQEKNITFADEAIARATERVWGDNLGIHKRYTKKQVKAGIRDRFRDDYTATIQKMKDDAATQSTIKKGEVGTAINAMQGFLGQVATSMGTGVGDTKNASVTVSATNLKEAQKQMADKKYKYRGGASMTQAAVVTIPNTKVQVKAGTNGFIFDDADKGTTTTVPYSDKRKLMTTLAAHMGKGTNIFPTNVSTADIEATLQAMPDQGGYLLNEIMAKIPTNIDMYSEDGAFLGSIDGDYETSQMISEKGQKTEEARAIAGTQARQRRLNELLDEGKTAVDAKAIIEQEQETTNEVIDANINRLETAINTASSQYGALNLGMGGSLTGLKVKEDKDGNKITGTFQVVGSAGARENPQTGVILPASVAKAAFGKLKDGELTDETGTSVAVKSGGFIFMPGVYYQLNDKGQYNIVNEANEVISPVGGDFQVIDEATFENIGQDVIDNIILESSERQIATPGVSQDVRIQALEGKTYGKDKAQLKSVTIGGIIGAGKTRGLQVTSDNRKEASLILIAKKVLDSQNVRATAENINKQIDVFLKGVGTYDAAMEETQSWDAKEMYKELVELNKELTGK